MILLYRLTGQVPSKKNSKRIFIHNRTGKLATLSSKKYYEWQSDAVKQIGCVNISSGIKLPLQKARIAIEFYAGDKRKFDLSNKAESIMDLLVYCGVIEDDNYSCVPELVLKYAGYRKNAWSTEITITDVLTNC